MFGLQCSELQNISKVTLEEIVFIEMGTHSFFKHLTECYM